MAGGGFGGGGGGALAGFAAGGGMPVPAPAVANTGGAPQQKSVDKIRNVFPETWLWSNSSVGYWTDTYSAAGPYAWTDTYSAAGPYAWNGTHRRRPNPNTLKLP